MNFFFFDFGYFSGISLSSPLTGSGLHGRAQVSPLLLQLGQVASDVVLPLHQLLLFGLQPLGVGLHAVLAVLALIRVCSHKEKEVKTCRVFLSISHTL